MNGRPSLARSSAPIPMPVSLTKMRTIPSLATALTPTLPPSGVNFTALDSRFSRICCTAR
jgi:hypothetical protein